MMQRTLIWDLPTRVFHWSLAISFALAWLTAESDAWLTLHVFCGYLMFALVVFRLLWGMVGSHFSRFANFWFAPSQVLAYLNQLRRGQAPRHIGHNPAGSLAIYLLLALALAVTKTEKQHVHLIERHAGYEFYFCLAIKTFVYIGKQIACVTLAVHENYFGFRMVHKQANEFTCRVSGTA